MLRGVGINAGYAKLHILYNVDFEAHEKGITVVVGPNGSGKSTLLKTFMGLSTLYSGKIYLGGDDITRYPPHRRARMGLIYLPQTDNIFVNLTIIENMRMALYSVGGNEEKKIGEALELFPELKSITRYKAYQLSGGQRQMLALAMAMVRSPRVLMVDEPTAQLSPKLAKAILGKIVEIRDQMRVPIILVEQNARSALEIGDKAYLLVSGRVAYEGPTQELLEHRELAKLYLGL
ncbi:MAG: ABC transporter ATP-binding protein [Desulfurococcales archaeon]|jgi:branched-chain amino acid transport system ATP-binding protein|nr:ABC transporter ATP-binding protein [Desulfurococcales archaeon]